MMHSAHVSGIQTSTMHRRARVREKALETALYLPRGSITDLQCEHHLPEVDSQTALAVWVLQRFPQGYILVDLQRDPVIQGGACLGSLAGLAGRTMAARSGSLLGQLGSGLAIPEESASLPGLRDSVRDHQKVSWRGLRDSAPCCQRYPTMGFCALEVEAAAATHLSAAVADQMTASQELFGAESLLSAPLC